MSAWRDDDEAGTVMGTGKPSAYITNQGPTPVQPMSEDGSTQEVQGDVADNVAGSPNPVLAGGVAADPASLPAAATAGRVVKLLTDLSRRLLTFTLLAAGEAHIGQVGATSKRVRAEKTRPNDTDAYTANDAISESASTGTNWTFAVGRIAAGTGVIVGAMIASDDVATALGTLELDLYDDTITAINDNAEATQLYANQGKKIRTLIFPVLTKKTTNSTMAEAELTNLNIPYACVGNGSIYGVLRAVTGFTPVASKKFMVTLAVLQD